MSRFKNRLVKRAMAIILSGAMILSCMPASCMPASCMVAYASEALEDTGGGYVEEVLDDTDENNAVDEDVEADTTTETTVAETTAKNENNNTDKRDDSKDTETEITTADEADGDDVDEKDIVKSTAKDEEKEVKDEDVKSGTLLEMESGSTYIFNVNDMEAFAASSEKEGKQILSSDGYFALICGASTVIDANRNDKSYTITDEKQAKSETFTKRLATGGNPTTGRQSIQFKTKSGVDVTVYWMSKGTSESPRQMSILDADGTKKTETQVITTFSNSMYVSTMTLDDAGTYYLGGNNYIYKVIVEPKKNATETQIPTTWDFSDKTKFPEMKLDTTKGTEQGFQACALEYCGLQVDTNKNNNDVLQTGNAGGGKFYVKSDTNVQTNQNTIIRIPIEGKSKVTLTMYSGAETYKVDGETAGNGKTQSFICNGENGYATLTIIKTGEYLQKIEVKKLSKVTVSGSVTTTPEKTDAYQVVFTDKKSKEIITADVTGGSYTAQLYENAAYTVSLSDKSYNVTEGAEITIAENATTVPALNITATAMSTETVEGTVTFPTTIPSDLKLTFKEKDGVHTVSDIEITTQDNVNKYSADLQSGKTYTVTATGTRINDYELVSDEVTSSSPNLEFKAKETYPITLAVTSFDDNAIDRSKIKLVFTNVNEEGYTYNFEGTDSIALRTGTYSVSAKAGYPYIPVKIAAFEVEGVAKTCTLDFAERLEWSFHTGSDLMAAENQISAQGASAGENGIVDLEGLKIDVTNGKFSTSGRNADAQVNQGTIIKIPLRTKSEVTIEGYDEASAYTVDGRANTSITDTFVCEGADGYATFVMLPKKEEILGKYGEYLKGITVSPINEAVIPDNRKIDIWDFGGKVETDTKYNNNITPQKWLASNLLNTASANKGKFIGDTKTSYTYDFENSDLTMNYIGEDRLYSNITSLSTIVVGDGKGTADNAYSDGYTAAGGWYCSGSGDTSTRNISIKNVRAGDIIIVYAGQHLSDKDGNVYGPITYHFEGEGTAKGQDDTLSLEGTGRKYEKFVFIAQKSGAYKIWPECESKGKPLYNRVVRIPGVKVSGTIDFGTYTGSGHTVKFVNETTKVESVAELDGSSFTVYLAPGYKYTAILSGAPGFGFASEGKTVEPTEAQITDGLKNVRLSVEAKDMYAYTGKFTGFEEGYNTERLAVTMTPPADSKADNVILQINKEDLTFTADLESNLEYTIQMEGVDDYVVKTPLTVTSSGQDLSKDITVALKPKHAVTGGFIGLEGDAAVTELKFALLDESGSEDRNYVYTAAVNDGSYSVDLRDGTYAAKATVSVTGYKMDAHVVVTGKDVYKDLMFVSNATESIPWAANIYVGYPGKQNNYKTVREAVKAAERMPKPASEEKRITIHIAPGTYREQVIVTVPYITFTNDEAPKEVKITWYYGIGYAYYSAKGGYYDEASAHDKYEKNNADRWGCAVKIKAAYFRAENIVFENSFNRYITEEEIADGVELHTEGTDSKATFVRTAGLTDAQVASKAATERAAAIAIDADNAEFYKCEFYGSQDTVYTGGGDAYHSYFKECLLEGNTDFLFGDSNTVYEKCELSFAGYSDAGMKYGGIIAVNKAEATKGYLFLGCTITRSKTYNNGFGDLGRPWGANARVIFADTIQESADLITDAAWQDMNGKAEDNPNYYEYNTKLPNGTEITPKAGSVRAAKYKEPSPLPVKTDYFGSWTPFYLTYDETAVVKEPVSSEKRSDVPTGTTIKLTSATQGAKIYYTTDESEPTENSTLCPADGISLGNEEKTVIIKAVAIKDDVKSNVAIFEYHVLSQENLIAAPTATVEPGKVDAGTVVRLNCATQGAAIYYTTNGDDPTVKSELLYKNQPIVINQTMTIKAIAAKDTNVSSVASFTYEVESTMPEKPTITAEPDDGTAFPSTGGTVTLTANPNDAKIYYTTSAAQNDLTDPADESNTKRVEYITGTPIQITEETYVWAVAISDGLASDPLKCHYTVLAEGAVVSPVATPDGLEPVKSGTIVTLTVTDNTVEHIYYTTDGSDPREASEARKTYNENTGIEITDAVMIKAVAQKGDTYSAVVTYTYTIASGGDTPEVKTIKLSECIISVPSILYNTKAGEKQPSTTYVIYKYKDGDIEKSVKFAEGVDYEVEWKGQKDSATDTTLYYAILSGCRRSEEARTQDGYIIDNDEKLKGEVSYHVYQKPTKNDTVKTVDFSKVKVTLKKDDVKNAIYTGYAIQPGLDWSKDKDGLETTLEGRLNIAYKNNINAGKASVIISVKPDPSDTTRYVGSKTLTFTIKKAALNKKEDKAQVKVEWASSFSFTEKHDYTGTPIEVTQLAVKTKAGRTLTKNEDYTVTYKNNAKAGKATVTVKGVGNNVSGSWSNTFEINPVSLDTLDLASVTAELPYSPKGAKVTGFTARSTDGKTTYKLKEGVDYTAKYVYTEKQTKAPDSFVKVTISGKGAFTGKDKQLGAADGFKIVKANFSTDITVSDDIVLDAAVAATGDDKIQKALEKAIVVTDASGVKFKVNKDYTVTRNAAIATSKASVTLTPAGANAAYYENTLTKNYRVATNLAKDKKFAFDPTLDKNDSLAYDGRNPVRLRAADIDKYINQIASSDPDYSNRPYKLGENIEIVQGTYKNNTKKGTAQVTVRGIAGVDGGFYGTKVLKFKIVEK